MNVKIKDIMDAVDFDNDDSESFLNTKTKQVSTFTSEELQAAEKNEDLSDAAEWYAEIISNAKQYLENESDYFPLPDRYDFHEYRVMEEFIDGLSNQKQADILSQAIHNKGAFRRFKDTLHRLDLIEKWYTFREQKLREFVELWCVENKIEYE